MSARWTFQRHSGIVARRISSLVRGPEVRVLPLAAIAALFASSALAASTQTAEDELASWHYVAHSLTYGGYETEGLSFYANCEFKRLYVAVSMRAQPRQNGTALRLQFASGPLRLAIPARLQVSDMEAYAVGDVKSRALLRVVPYRQADHGQSGRRQPAASAALSAKRRHRRPPA
ncbi:hypothetical protein [Ralstonia mannitolilytica]|uniref:hypothetical protein n=1 Tax=Ralstonia mannitolilytica TaxID=105219 RepID=UPI001EE7250F|nr:hypothetical protein [Ralstonia mannitolilytica]